MKNLVSVRNNSRKLLWSKYNGVHYYIIIWVASPVISYETSSWGKLAQIYPDYQRHSYIIHTSDRYRRHIFLCKNVKKTFGFSFICNRCEHLKHTYKPKTNFLFDLLLFTLFENASFKNDWMDAILIHSFV